VLNIARRQHNRFDWLLNLNSPDLSKKYAFVRSISSTAPLTIFTLLQEQDSNRLLLPSNYRHDDRPTLRRRLLLRILLCSSQKVTPMWSMMPQASLLRCSKDCQSSDWKEASHKHLCGKAGEIGIDYDIRPIEDGRGLGVFTRRSFEKNDIIMAERPII
jgi:hypothetical protein